MSEKNVPQPDYRSILCSDNPDRLRRYREITEFAGFGPPQLASLLETPSAISQKAGLSVAVVDLLQADEQGFLAAAKAAEISETREIARIFLLSPPDIDRFYAAMPDSPADILLDDSAEEYLASLGRAMAMGRHMLFDSSTDNPVQDLRRISADVARIAQALVQLSGDNVVGNAPFDNSLSYIQPAADTSVHDAALRYSGDDGTLTGFGSSGPAEAERQTITAKYVRNIIKARRLREQYFVAELFADPAWDILLDLMAAHLENRLVSVSSLCIAACVPPTTALRWVRTMTESGILIRRADITDGRRVFITLSQETIAGLIGYFANVRRQRLLMG